MQAPCLPHRNVPASSGARPAGAVHAFSLVELLVVIGIIVLLVGLVIGVGSAMVKNAQRRDTQGMLSTIELAIEQFHEDAPLAGVQDFMARYGGYPPDELQPFVISTGSDPGVPVQGGGGSIINPNNTASVNAITALGGIDNRDVKALVLAIRLFSDTGAQILDRIDARFKGAANTNECWDRDYSPGGDCGETDLPLEFFVDSWGTVIEYYAVNPQSATVDVAASTDSTGDRLAASRDFVRENKGRPLLVSYGPDGPDQFSGDFLVTEAGDLVEDYNDGDTRINNRFNVDNVYVDDGVGERLRAN